MQMNSSIFPLPLKEMLPTVMGDQPAIVTMTDPFVTGVDGKDIRRVTVGRELVSVVFVEVMNISERSARSMTTPGSCSNQSVQFAAVTTLERIALSANRQTD